MMGMMQDTLALTLRDPRAAARQIMGWQISLSGGWTALLLVSVVSAMLGYLGFALSPAQDDAQLQAMFGSPLRTALVQVGVQGATALMVWGVGRQFGGKGGLADALVLTAWVEVPLIGLQLIQLIALFVAPLLADVAGVLGLGLYAVLLTLFTTELHGFRSAMFVFVGLLGVSLVAGFALVAFVAILMGGIPRV